jgi:hypothetical protein
VGRIGAGQTEVAGQVDLRVMRQRQALQLAADALGNGSGVVRTQGAAQDRERIPP